MLPQLPTNELHALRQLLHAIDPILDAHPAVKTHGFQRPEDRIVVVQTLANRPVPEAFGVALRPGFIPAQILDCALGQIAITRVHGHDPVLHSLEQLQRIIPREKRILGS